MTGLRSLGIALSVLIATGPALAESVTLPDVQSVALENGVVLIVHEKHDVPLIGLEALIRGGAVSDPDGKAGLASLLAGMLEKGAGDRDAAAFAEAVDSVGASLSAGAGLESITISGEFLARDADLMIELLVDMLQSPSLGRVELNKLKERQINLLRAAKDGDARWLTPVYGNAFLFGEHPYGTSVFGSEASLAKIAQRDLLDFYSDHVGADRLIIAVAGAFDAMEMIDKLSAAFGEWRAAGASLPVIEPAAPETGRRVLLVDKPGAAQSYFWIGNVGVDIGFPERAELDIANTLFGGRYTSLLMTELRARTGLTYSARSVLRRPSGPGSVAIVSFTKTETTIEAIDLALGLLAKLHLESFDDEAIASGKNYILGQFPTGLETAEQLAAQFAMLEANGLDASFINDYGAAVTAADAEKIRGVIDRVYPQPENLVFVIIGDADLIREDVATYGPITEIAITEPQFRP